MALIDQDYHQFEFALENEKNAKDLISAISVLGLTAAATVVAGPETKTILSALAGGVTGVNLAADKVFFKEMTLQAIRNQMRTLRSTKKADILTHKQSDVQHYSLDMAVSDVVDYYYCGYVYRALDELVNASGVTASKAEDAAKAPAAAGTPKK